MDWFRNTCSFRCRRHAAAVLKDCCVPATKQSWLAAECVLLFCAAHMHASNPSKLRVCRHYTVCPPTTCPLNAPGICPSTDGPSRIPATIYASLHNLGCRDAYGRVIADIEAMLEARRKHFQCAPSTPIAA